MNFQKYSGIGLLNKYNLHFIVICFIVFSPFFFPLAFESRIFFHLGLYIALSNCTVYLLNIYYFIPRLLKKKKIYLFFIGLLCTIIFFSILTNLFFSLLPIEELPADFRLRQGNNELTFVNITSQILGPSFPVLFIFAIGTSIEITHDWMGQENKKREIENEKLQSELSFLKSQINPHFLFNTLNNIYSLAADKSDDTEKAILKLSALMRYVLYDSNVPLIALDKEVEHIENYISLQKLRLSAKKNIEIKLSVTGNTRDKMIEPMLLIPFVENAFKHGLSYIKNSQIDMRIESKETGITFSIDNSKMTKNIDFIDENSGIGLKNVKRRLELLYPDNHQLEIVETTEMYKVRLNLKIYENEMSGY